MCQVAQGFCRAQARNAERLFHLKDIYKAACLCANAPLRPHIFRRPRRVCWRTVLRANMQLAFTVALLVALLACAGE